MGGVRHASVQEYGRASTTFLISRTEDPNSYKGPPAWWETINGEADGFNESQSTPWMICLRIEVFAIHEDFWMGHRPFLGRERECAFSTMGTNAEEPTRMRLSRFSMF
jgi:hypothetical protein